MISLAFRENRAHVYYLSVALAKYTQKGLEFEIVTVRPSKTSINFFKKW